MLDPLSSTPIIQGSMSTTFTFNGGGGSSAAVNIYWLKIGDWVILFVPPVTGTPASGTVTRFRSDNALPSFLRPLTNTPNYAIPIENAGAQLVTPGLAAVTTAGNIDFYKDMTAAGTYTNGSVAGSPDQVIMPYYVGVGS